LTLRREVISTIFPKSKRKKLLQFYGTEGEKGLHQAIHLETIKYVKAALYASTENNILAIFSLNAILFFAPILYFLRTYPTSGSNDRRFLILFGLLYATYPSASSP
jgi:hypothetical protein